MGPVLKGGIRNESKGKEPSANPKKMADQISVRPANTVWVGGELISATKRHTHVPRFASRRINFFKDPVSRDFTYAVNREALLLVPEGAGELDVS